MRPVLLNNLYGNFNLRMGEDEKTSSSEPEGLIGLYVISGGAEATPLDDRIRLFHSLVADIDLRSYGDLHGIGIGVFIDGSVDCHGLDGVTGVRFVKKRGEIWGKIGVFESVWRGVDESVVTEWFGNQLRTLFEKFAARLLKSGRQIDLDAFLRDMKEIVHLMEILPPLPPGKGQAEIMRRLRNYLSSQRLAAALGDKVPPPIGLRPGYEWVLDDQSPDGIRLIVGKPPLTI